MKKIFIAIAALSVLTFTSCGNSTPQAEENDTIDTVVIEEEKVVEATEEAEAMVSNLSSAVKAGNTDAIKSKIEEAKEYIEYLASEGKSEAVKAYVEKLKQFVEANQDKINELTDGTTKISELISGISALPTSAQELINSAAEAASSEKDAAVEAGKSAIDNAKEEVKSKVEEKINEAKDEAKSKAYEAGKKAGEDAKKALNDAAEEAKKKLGF